MTYRARGRTDGAARRESGAAVLRQTPLRRGSSAGAVLFGGGARHGALVLSILAIGCGAGAQGDPAADSSFDASTDVPIETPADTAADSATDTATEATADASTDVRPETPDASTDSGTDGRADSPDDVPAEVSSDALGDGADADAHDAVDACPTASCGGACVDLTTDVHHCGACSVDCTTLPNVVTGATCAAGRCDVSHACAAGFADCDHDPSNGCEADLGTAAHCGSCATACSGATPACASDTHTCVSGCSGATPTRCGPSCVDTATDPAHCGDCATACAVPAHGTATCVAGGCGIACVAGFHACGATCADDTAVASCGASCTACPTPPNATPTCSGTACGFMCLSGWRDADGDPTNGCETACAPLPSGAVSWYRAEGNARDALGVNDGTYDPALVTFVAGEVNQSFARLGDKLGSEVHATSVGLPIGGSDRTVETWVNPLGTAPDQYWLVRYGTPGTTNGAFILGLFNDLSPFVSQWGMSIRGAPLSGGYLNHWHHLAATVAGGVYTLYVDGAAVATAAMPTDTPPGTSLVLGGGSVSSCCYFGPINGDVDLDEVTLYNRALTSAEIGAIAAAGHGGKCF